jgi:plasmid maintenance system antidote protein VapI
MEIEEIIYRNFMVLSRKYNADTPNKLKVVLKCSKQHASALLNKVSPIGKLTVKKLAKAWGISPDDFYKEEMVTLNHRKFPKREQKILVFYKGNIDKIKDLYAPIGRL